MKRQTDNANPFPGLEDALHPMSTGGSSYTTEWRVRSWIGLRIARLAFLILDVVDHRDLGYWFPELWEGTPTAEQDGEREA